MFRGSEGAQSPRDTVTATYDARNRLTQTVLSNRLTQTFATTNYSWTARGTLASTSTGTTTTTQKFDAFDRLISDTTGAATTYLYDDLDRLVQSGSGRLTYAGLARRPSTDATSAVLTSPDGVPLAMRSGSVSSAVLQNVHHDVIAGLAPATGTVAAGRQYDAFGAVTASVGSQLPLGFQGSWTDAGTGRVDADARWYEPSTGTFLSRDSQPPAIATAADASLYGYAAGNPSSRYDPTGHSFIGEIVQGVGRIGSAIAGGAHDAISLGADELAALGEMAVNFGETAAEVTYGAATGLSTETLALLEGAGDVAAGLGEVTLAGATCAAWCVAALVVGAVVVIAGFVYVVSSNHTLVPSAPPRASGVPGPPGTKPVPGSTKTPPVNAPTNTRKPAPPPKVTPPVTEAPPPPPPAPYIATVVTVSITETSTTVDKWHEGGYIYTKTDTKSVTTTSVTTNYSDGSWTRAPGDRSTYEQWVVQWTSILDLADTVSAELPDVPEPPDVGTADAPVDEAAMAASAPQAPLPAGAGSGRGSTGPPTTGLPSPGDEDPLWSEGGGPPDFSRLPEEPTRDQWVSGTEDRVSDPLARMPSKVNAEAAMGRLSPWRKVLFVVGRFLKAGHDSNWNF